MLTFATTGGQPRHFSTDFVFTYVIKESLLKVNQKGQPVHFLIDNMAQPACPMAGMNEQQFLKLCDLVCAVSGTEEVSHRHESRNGIVTVKFEVDRIAAVASGAS